MGKKGYNWKSRQIVNTVIDNSSTEKIKLEINVDGHYDKSNEFALPAEKRKTKVKEKKQQITRILSKKHRKKLEKIVDKKKKKENRASLLEALSQVQATPEELAKLTSISRVQTIGLRKYTQDYVENTTFDVNDEKQEIKLNSIKGAKRKRLQLLDKEKTDKITDPNVVGFDTDSDTANDESDTDEDVREYKTPKLDPPVDEISIVSKPEISTNSEQKIEKAVKSGVVEIKENKNVERKPAVYVEVDRSEEIQKARLKLPILAEEQQIMEIINESSVIIIAGETGSGKTTQVPQFLYEAGYALKKMIGITEPRRVAAIAMSKRVGEELNLTADIVSYLIRFEGNVTDETKLKFMTDGVLLKEIQNDFLLTKYSVIILDEAHERSVYTDVLIGMLSRIVPQRNKKGDPLKLIIMSATLRLEDFTNNTRLFKTKPPVIKVEARQFPVTVHFNKRTNENYLKEAFNKVVKIHTKLPDGGVLVFLTGQKEVNSLVRKLRKAFPLRNRSKYLREAQINNDEDENDEDEKELDMMLKRKKKKKLKIIPEINLDDYSLPGDYEESEHSESDTENEAEDVPVLSTSQPLWVLPLYSLLPSHKQAKVFEQPPAGCRLCVVSTNVAETSLTIPNVKYVVDSGKTKSKLYDKITGVSSYVITWTSKASAEQRAGRAGRTGPGHCYRLYSSAVYNDVFEKFSVPEIQQKPVDDLYLQMKCMHIDKVVNFPFPTAPDLLQLKTSEYRLEVLQALTKGKVTSLGKAIAKFPVLPRFGKMLALSHQQNLLPYTICMVASLSVQEVLLENPVVQLNAEEAKALRQKWIIIRRNWAGIGNSLLLGDPMVLLRAVGAAEYANSQGTLEKFCDENGLRYKALIEIRKLRIQLTNEIKTNIPDADVVVDPKLKPPTDLQSKLLRQLLLAGMGDQVAKKINVEDIKEAEDKVKYKYAYYANNMEDPVFLHQGSILKKKLPEYVVYQEIYETKKMYMRGVTAIEPEWLITYVPSLCNLNEPLLDPEPRYDVSTDSVKCTVNGTFGTQNWTLPNVEIDYPNNVDCYKWFAKCLLEGIVVKKLAKYTKDLLSMPSIMVKSWAKLQPRTEFILKALYSKQINNKTKLLNVWKDEPKYLLQEYLKWVPEAIHGDVTLLWPPI